MADQPLVTVSMPYRGCPSTVRRAVQSVLAQTMTDLRLIVINDGDTDTPPWPMLDDIADNRLTRFDLARHRGRYYCDAVALAACASPWFAIHDADDYAEPEWLDTLCHLADQSDAVAAFAPQHVHALSGAVIVEPTRFTPPPHPTSDGHVYRLAPAERMQHLAHHAGVYRVDALRAVGIHPGFKIGYDTLLVNLIAMSGPVAVAPRPLYHRVARIGSLTRAPDTGMASPARRRARADLDRLYQRALSVSPVGVVAADLTVSLVNGVTGDAARLAAGDTVAPGRYRSTAGALTTARWGGWALDPITAHALAEHLHTASPPVVVECGSGSSTLLLAEHAARTGATVITLEHSPDHAARTARLLAAAGLTDRVQLRLARLVAAPAPAPPGSLFYTLADPMPDGVRFVLIDGPPGEKIGRAGALPALWPYLDHAGDWQAWLDDAHRRGEAACLTLWADTLGTHHDIIDTPHGLARIAPHPIGPAPVDAADVAVTVLTGRRPHLLAATMASLDARAPGLLDTAHVRVLHNGSDVLAATTRDVLDGYPVDVVDDVDRLIPVGPAVSRLAAALPATGRRYWLHVEDDWVSCGVGSGWLDVARIALDADPDLGQVRVRCRAEPVRTDNMDTGAAIRWTDTGAGMLVGDAHYTLNPSVMRVADAARVFPAASERAAMRRYTTAGFTVAQVIPGAFRHIGDGMSLHPRRRP